LVLSVASTLVDVVRDERSDHPEAILLVLAPAAFVVVTGGALFSVYRTRRLDP